MQDFHTLKSVPENLTNPAEASFQNGRQNLPHISMDWKNMNNQVANYYSKECILMDIAIVIEQV